MKRSREACIDLLAALVEKGGARSEWLAALRTAGAAIVQGLAANLSQDQDRGELNEDDFGPSWWSPPGRKPVPASTVETLLRTLQRLVAPRLAEQAAKSITTDTKTWVPDSVVIPGLAALYGQDRRTLAKDPAFPILWRHCAEFLLARSGVPPTAPSDWAQAVEIDCRCGDCVELKRFATDPNEQVHRFRVAKERRRHLHGIIERQRLDMTHETDRIGSPQTLVCTKTRASYKKRCQQYAKDIGHLKTLAKLGSELPSPFEDLRQEVGQAIDRRPERFAERSV
jgi:hypothetical protein